MSDQIKLLSWKSLFLVCDESIEEYIECPGIMEYVMGLINRIYLNHCLMSYNLWKVYQNQRRMKSLWIGGKY